MKPATENSALPERFAATVQAKAAEFGVELRPPVGEQLQRYYEMVVKWNKALSLVGPCSPEEFATRHVLESLTLLSHLAPGASMVDIGSGAGLPGVPCVIARGDLRATLIESSGKKATFLREVARELGLTDRLQVVAARFEQTPAPSVGYVTSRALERFREILPALIDWSPANSTLLLFGGEALCTQARTLLTDVTVELIPGSDRRFLIVARRHS